MRAAVIPAKVPREIEPSQSKLKVPKVAGGSGTNPDNLGKQLNETQAITAKLVRNLALRDAKKR